MGRITTSLIAITCLRAQQGVGPQVLSHVFGLRKAWEDGTWKQEPEAGEEEGIKWLVSDEGCTWILEKVDELVEALGGGPLRPSSLALRAISRCHHEMIKRTSQPW